MDRVAQQPDRASEHRQQQLNQAGGSEADRADSNRPVGLPPLVGVVATACQRERRGRVTLPQGLVHPARIGGAIRLSGLSPQPPGTTAWGCLEHGGGDRDADTDEDYAAKQFAPLAGPGADPAAQLQPDQGHDDAHGADDDRGHGEADVEGAQGKADREVVDAQGRTRDQQPPGPLATRCGRVLVLAAVRAA